MSGSDGPRSPHAGDHETSRAHSVTVARDTSSCTKQDKVSQLKKNHDGGFKRTRSAPGLAQEGNQAALPKIRIGICAMDKKARSKQMRAILERLMAFGEFEVEIFGDDVILNKPVQKWPTCDCLLSWHSEGFPLHKAQKYAALRRPYLINDMLMQDVLLDRRAVYKLLQDNGIPVPRHIVVSRDSLPKGQTDPEGFTETEECVEMHGLKINKPFVEKPICGDNHNIYIYYPHSMGGGVKRLYRKVENRSGDYDPTHPGTVRRKGSYIYEEFLTTGGTDVKVYTVGPRYAHAEARKSPVVDGKVTRSADGKEVRFPVLLSPQEKEIARMVCLAFGQKVCGFDLLRSERGKSYVCDVNGWSFVKNSYKYYDDAAGILRSIVLSAIAPHRLAAPMPAPGNYGAPDGTMASYPVDPTASPLRDEDGGFEGDDEEMAEDGDQFEELRCVLAVIRHGDRTPKQKMKMKVTQEPMLDLLRKHLDGKGKQAKLKSPSELQELLDVTRELLQGMERAPPGPGGPPGLGGGGGSGASSAASEHAETAAETDADEVREKFRIVKTVLEQGGQFAGINRKAQLKPLRWTTPEPGSGEPPRIVEALLILKHGGVLTHAGRQQAEALGNVFRTVMYPRYGPAGGGLLRLHSTYRHDLKIYSSDEGRVQTSAAAFTQGLLDLEGTSLTPILVSLVKKDAGMLDAFGKGASEDIRQAKSEVYSQMTWDSESNVSLYTEPQMTTPLPSPPPSPNLLGGSAPTGDVMSVLRMTSSPAGSVKVLEQLNTTESPSHAPPSAATTPRALFRSTSEMGPSRRSTMEHGEAARPTIYPMPKNPLALLKAMVGHIQVLVEKLRQKCLEERVQRNGEAPRSYSALLQSPREWALEPGKPCGGERLLLTFDRWRKLLKAFYNEKRKQFDISKVPDIYDSAKYDAIHNAELGLDLKPLYQMAKTLADSVIPNEYGISPDGKLRIGGKICSALLGKVMADMANMRDESLATAGIDGSSEPVSPFDSYANMTNVADLNLGRNGDAQPPAGPASEGGGSGLQLPERSQTTSAADEAGARGGEDGEGSEQDEEDRETLHRLCPTYAQDINSPLRHVRTRIYFTSESHVHSLINVLRFCHLGREPEQSLLSDEAQAMLRNASELDYMTHIVFRMFENKRVSVDSPERFRIELWFSPGASYNPYEVVPLKQDHTLPVAPRVPLHQDRGASWLQLEKLLTRYATPTKASTYTYSMC